VDDDHHDDDDLSRGTSVLVPPSYSILSGRACRDHGLDKSLSEASRQLSSCMKATLNLGELDAEHATKAHHAFGGGAGGAGGGSVRDILRLPSRQLDTSVELPSRDEVGFHHPHHQRPPSSVDYEYSRESQSSRMGGMGGMGGSASASSVNYENSRASVHYESSREEASLSAMDSRVLGGARGGGGGGGGSGGSGGGGGRSQVAVRVRGGGGGGHGDDGGGNSGDSGGSGDEAPISSALEDAKRLRGLVSKMARNMHNKSLTIRAFPTSSPLPTLPDHAHHASHVSGGRQLLNRTYGNSSSTGSLLYGSSRNK
jgi:hypothetical protein